MAKFEQRWKKKMKKKVCLELALRELKNEKDCLHEQNTIKYTTVDLCKGGSLVYKNITKISLYLQNQCLWSKLWA